MQTPEQQVIRRISGIIAQTPDYDDGLCQALQCLAEHLHVDACTVLVYDDVDGKLVVEGTYGLGRDAVQTVQLSPDQGITGHSFRTGKVVNVADKSTHPLFFSFRSSQSAEYHALLTVPLCVAGRAIGVLDLERKVCGVYDDEVVSAACAVAPSLAMFILNAHLAKERVGSARRPSVSRPHHAFALTGRAVTEGFGQGTALVIRGIELLENVPSEQSGSPEQELEFMARAIQLAVQETEHIQAHAATVLAEADASIFEAHLMLLQDPTIHHRLTDQLRNGMSLRPGLSRVLRSFEREWAKLDSDFMKERLADLKDVLLRIYLAADLIEGVANGSEVDLTNVASHAKLVAVARELLPSQLLQIPLKHLAAIVCEEGGATSHAAILARALDVPMLTGVADVTNTIHTGEQVVVDCDTGSCYVNASQAMLKRLSRKSLSVPETTGSSIPESCTRDGTQVRLAGNLSLLNELPCLERYGAQGVGLYRTEFMFMLRSTCPNEEEQHSVFRKVVAACQGVPATIRVLDIGGDKPLPYVDIGHEDNPFLGWRGIRFLLSNRDFFRPHLRAILRTTGAGPVDILLPMVADLEELLEVKAFMVSMQSELENEGVEVGSCYRLGIMLEVPAAVWQLPVMLPHIDFVSIGTNDLTQYTLAVDRGNSRVSQWYRHFHPVILRVIRETAETVAQFPGKELAICGEIAGMTMALPFLIGAGLRNLSMNPHKLPAIRESLRKVDICACEDHARRVLQCNLYADVVKHMEAFACEHGLGK